MTTAFVLAGGGSIGAVQVGMVRELLAHGVAPDLVVGSSAGAINGAYLAGAPSLEGVRELETIWRGLRRHQVFPITWRTMMGAIELIERAAEQTRRWLQRGGLEKRRIPGALRPHED